MTTTIKNRLGQQLTQIAFENKLTLAQAMVRHGVTDLAIYLPAGIADEGPVVWRKVGDMDAAVIRAESYLNSMGFQRRA